MRLGGTCVVAALLLSPPASALESAKALTQYAHANWSLDQGLPQSSVYALAQTPDGFLWLGTEEGLVRFDGVEFTVYDRAHVEALAENAIRALAVDAAGDLWIGLASH